MIVERQPAAHHLVHDDPDAPPVHGHTVIVILEHLRGEVLGSTAKGLGRVPKLHVFLAQPEVGNLYVTVVIEEQVFKLKKEKKTWDYIFF